MPTLLTGYVKTTGFGVKIRKSIFARKKTEFAELSNDEVARAVAEINQKIFEELRNMSVNRDDVLKISVDYKVQNNKIVFDYSTLNIQVFKPVQARLQKIFDSEEERKIIERIIGELNSFVEEMKNVTSKMSNLIQEIREVYNQQVSS